jgi:hypothetical protein
MGHDCERIGKGISLFWIARVQNIERYYPRVRKTPEIDASNLIDKKKSRKGAPSGRTFLGCFHPNLEVELQSELNLPWIGTS